ncbi:MAG: enoyl-CoA hydratase [Actinomycetota bacterium]|nr:enoyl-CoA hydratase [Actinomycetota bacterium]
MSDDVVLYEVREPGVALLTLNRPDRLNAWTNELGNRYFELLDRAAADPAVKAIVVTGAGRGFCAGADMNTLQQLGASKGGADGNGAAAAAGTRPQYTTTLVPKPVIAAINGACAGMGLSQALMCDMRFAAAGAKLTTSFGQRGLIAEWGLAWVLPRLMGTAKAFDLLFSGRVVLAEEAAEMGLINAVLPPDQLLEHALAYAANLALTVSPTSMAVMKRQVYADWTKDLITAHDDAVRLMAQSLKRPDFVEGVNSYLEKRPPSFSPIDPNA